MDDGEQDEELLGPPPREWRALRRFRRPLTALAVLAVIVAAAVSLTRSGDRSHRASRSPSTTAAPSPLPLRSLGPLHVPPADVLPADDQALPDPPLPLCPVGRLCEVSYSLPDAVYAALRVVLGRPAFVSSSTLLSRRSPDVTVLVARVVSVSSGTQRFSIEVRRPQPGDAPAASLTDDRVHASALARAHVPGYTITVRAVAPSGTRLSLPTLTRLAEDRRLLVRPAAGRNQSDDPGQR